MILEWCKIANALFQRMTWALARRVLIQVATLGAGLLIAAGLRFGPRCLAPQANATAA
jgi:hypothetical protein